MDGVTFSHNETFGHITGTEAVPSNVYLVIKFSVYLPEAAALFDFVIVYSISKGMQQ